MEDPSDPEIAPRRLLFFLSAERVSAGGGWLHGAAWSAVRADGGRKMCPRRLKKCAPHRARQDGAIAIMTRRRHYAARTPRSVVLSMERRCRSVVWCRKKVRCLIRCNTAHVRSRAEICQRHGQDGGAQERAPSNNGIHGYTRRHDTRSRVPRTCDSHAPTCRCRVHPR